MTKLEAGKEYWVKGRVEEIQKMYRCAPYLVKFEGWRSWVPDDVEVVEVIPEREKVTIPKEVADWLEMCKGDGGVGLSYALSSDDMSEDVYCWLQGQKSYELDNCNQDTFAIAWLDGYEIEKEPLYYVKIPNVFHGYFGYSERFDNYSFYNKEDATEIRFELTEEEIKQNHEWAWQFAVPVEEEVQNGDKL